MANFPTSAPSFAGFTSGHTLSADNHAAQHNLEQGEIVALASKVGTGASTPVASRLLRGTGVGTSAWAQADLTTDVTGVLPQANGGTGTTLATGTGKAVYDTSPTISGASLTSSPTLTTPIIGDFTNSTHTHASNAQGGLLNAANALSAGSVSFANLLSTIFSGQVLSQANAGTAGGTMWWVNLGGIKLLWGLSASQTTTGTNSWAFTLPAFFTTLQSVQAGITQQGGTATQTIAGNVQSTSSIAHYITAGGGSSATYSILVIGT